MTLTITRPDDWHLHVRDGAALASVVPHTATQFGRAIIMPNLRPPVTTTAQALSYKERIAQAVPAAMAFEPLMTLYLTDVTPPDEIARAADAGIVALAVRKEMVSALEAVRIGYDVAYKLQACREAGPRNKEDSTLADRMRTAISGTFGFNKVFIDEVTEYKALSGVAGKMPAGGLELGISVLGTSHSSLWVLTEIDHPVQAMVVKG